MKRIFLSILIIVVCCCKVFATHIRAGEITYRNISGYTYEITVTTYSNTLGTSTDDCSVNVHFGDGDTAIVSRVNGPVIFGSPCDPTPGGVMLTGVANTRLNIYKTTHTYDGPFTYTITVNIANRNSGICNITNSVNTPFFLHTELVINPFMPANNSSTLLVLPIDQGCVAQCFEHNPGAYDIDGDSLYYSIIPCYASGFPIVPGFSMPPNMDYNDIDHQSGDLRWCAPPIICQYNIAIKIEEWKLLANTTTRYFAGSVVRDMQINIGTCLNTMPNLPPIPDTCVVAGTNINFDVTATDAENSVTLSAAGGPFLLSPAASFPTVTGINTVTGTFSWTPDCDAIQLLPYMVTFKAEDNDPNPLVNFESMFIQVVPPAPSGLTASPSGSSMILNWTPSLCADTAGTNPLKRYKIYRKNSCDPWLHGPCEIGVPGYTGYTYVGSTATGAITTFTDNNGGAGLLHGVDYSYLVVAYYSDGSQSYASGNVCAHLVRDVPIITNVSVIATSASTGEIWTHWAKPLGTAGNLDTIANPGPYEYRLLKATGLNPSASAFTLETSYSHAAYWQLNDTGFVSSALNTQNTPYAYRVDFYSDGNLKGSTHIASSVFLSSTPSDNKITLTWQENVPWMNYKYYIYKEIASAYTLIDSTTLQTYTDSNLVNGRTYCYKIQSRGDYSDTTLPRPLYNMSQIKCDSPIDLIPPCQPTVNIDTDCELVQNTLTWNNPNNSCSNDAIQYNVYYAQTTEDDLQLIYSTTNMNDTTYSHADSYDGIASVAGCYAVTAVDSFSNESVIIAKVCVDNCPVYELPNVFTPNGDNTNDFMVPLPYRFVKDIDIKIYDRWGLLMFQTTDPDIMWDGSTTSKKPCPDGTYFYICTVNEIRVQGITPRVLKGFVQLIRTKPSQAY